MGGKKIDQIFMIAANDERLGPEEHVMEPLTALDHGIALLRDNWTIDTTDMKTNAEERQNFDVLSVQGLAWIVVLNLKKNHVHPQELASVIRISVAKGSRRAELRTAFSSRCWMFWIY